MSNICLENDGNILPITIPQMVRNSGMGGSFVSGHVYGAGVCCMSVICVHVQRMLHKYGRIAAWLAGRVMFDPSMVCWPSRAPRPEPSSTQCAMK